MLLLQTSSIPAALGFLCLLLCWAVNPSSRKAFPSLFDPRACQAHPLCQDSFPHQRSQREGMGLQKCPISWASEKIPLVLPRVESPWMPMGSCVHPCRAWDSQGGEHTLEDSQERRFPPVGFSQCVDFDFYILCGLSPI